MQHDLIRARHMLTAAKEAMEFAAGKTRMDLEKDRLHMLCYHQKHRNYRRSSFKGYRNI